MRPEDQTSFSSAKVHGGPHLERREMWGTWQAFVEKGETVDSRV
jgi:hypothetical protein